MTAFDQRRKLAHHALAGARLTLLAVEGDQVPAQEHLALQLLLQRAQDGVLTARQLGGENVRQLDLRPHPLSAPRTSADTRLPSARPSTTAIAFPIARPMSFTDSAPLSRTTACSTISLSSSFGELRRQVAGDQLAFGLLGAGAVLLPRIAVGLGGLQAPFALAAQHRQLVV